MQDKTAVRDQIGFVLNGKPLELPPVLICPKCGVDRYKDPCPTPDIDCPIKAKSL